MTCREQWLKVKAPVTGWVASCFIHVSVERWGRSFSSLWPQVPLGAWPPPWWPRSSVGRTLISAVRNRTEHGEEKKHQSVSFFHPYWVYSIRNNSFSWTYTLSMRQESHLRETYWKREFHSLPQENYSVCVCVCACKCLHRLKIRSERNKNLYVGASNKPSMTCLIPGYL